MSRRTRSADYQAESRALSELAAVMSESPEKVFQKLADTALELCRAGSAGISVWEPGGPENVFRWRATAGAYAPYVGGTLPRDFSPCGAVLDRNASLLMSEPARAFPYILDLAAPVREVLLVPFHQNGFAIGTVWVVSHSSDVQFDAEDERVVTSLTRFAAAAVQSLNRIEAAEAAERSLQEGEERFRALVDATSDAVYLMGPDWTEMRHLRGRKFLPDASEPSSSWVEKYIPDEERERVSAAIAVSVKNKQTFELEHRVLRADGTTGWTFSRAIPRLNSAGEVIEWLGTATDITNRRATEEALEDIRSRMESALAAGAIGTWSWDVQNDRFHGDKSLARLFSVPDDAVSGGPIAKLFESIHPSDRERISERVTQALEIGGPYEADYRVAQADGTWKWITARGFVELDAAGRAVRFPGVVMDISERRRAEERLEKVTAESKRRKRLYETILSNTPDLAYVWDLDHRFTYANEGLLKMWGKTWDEAIGKNCLELGYEDWHAEMHSREIETVKSTKQPVRGEVPFTGTFGRRIYDYILVPVFGADGEVEAVAGTTRDVTERKEFEEKLLASEEQHRTLFTVMDQSYCVIEMMYDETGNPVDYRFLHANPAFSIHTGMENVEGRTVRELISNFESSFVERYARVARTGEPIRFVDYVDTLGRWFDVSAYRIANDGSNRVAILFTNVTERMRAESSIRFLADASASLSELGDYESTLQRIANLAVGLFADWCAVDIREENGSWKRLAVTVPEAGAERGASPFPDASAQGPIQKLLRSGEAVLVADVLAADNGTSQIGEEYLTQLRAKGIRSFVAAPLFSGGEVIGSISFLSASNAYRYGVTDLGVAQDLASRVSTAIENAQLYLKLQEQDRRKDEFLATLAHELRNPLAPVRNGVEILRMTAGEGASGKTLSMMDRQLGQLVHLVDDLMDLSRVSSGKVALRLGPVELRAVVDAAVETSRQLIDQAGHVLEVSPITEKMTVRGDKTRLVQVLSNLLNNAAKYTPAGGKISISTTRESGHSVIRITDNGVGIAPEMLPKIFDMFTQVGSSLERSQGGLGIGLTLVKRLVEMHGGKVTVESLGKGRGSTFLVRLPLAAGAARSEENALLRSGESGLGLNILVVDDNRDSAESLAELLGIQGHSVRVAHDGPQALRVMESMQPDFVVLDIGLPGMNGYEVAGRIRDSVRLRGVTLAALTGWGQDIDRQRTRNAGFDFHLVKPADPKKLDEIIREVSARIREGESSGQ